MRRTIILIFLLTILLPLAGWAQLPTGKLSGRVEAGDGAPLPGVTVTAKSEALQGERVVLTGASGDFLFPLLPPGSYTVTFELEGMQSQQMDVLISAAQARSVDVQMQVSELTETITVTGNQETISQDETASTTYSQDFMEELPVARNLRQAVLLAPGVQATGPKSSSSRSPNISMSGGMSFENLFLINGVVVNENVRGQNLDLFIEDAVQETTTSTSGVSAEYGRFSGGVVNMITKSGGNSWHGSGRVSFNNEDWEAPTPLTTGQADDIVETYEATTGGWFLRDHLWFFGAGRDVTTSTVAQTFITNIPFDSSTDQQRLEGKLTLSPSSSHSIVGSFIDRDQTTMNNTTQPAMELAAVDPSRGEPQTLKAVNYNGILTSNFFVEAQYSEREFTFVDAGGDDADLIRGTVLIDQQNGTLTYHAPFFCGEPCLDEKRNNENLLAKASYFLSTESGGSHDLVFGYDTFNDIIASDNHQSATDFHIWTDTTIIRGSGQETVLFPLINPFNSLVVWWPILESTKGTEFRTNSVFANDKWHVNDHLSVNLGVRWDGNDGVDSAGNKRVNDDKISPRIALNYDLKGDGDMMLSGSYATYVSAVANTIGNSQSSAGTPAILVWLYGGDPINPDPGAANLVSQDDAIREVFDWFNGIGGTGNLTSLFDPVNGALFGGNGYLVQTTIPGAGTEVGDLRSPSVDEITIGFRKRLGSHGFFRADYVNRSFEDFYFRRLDLSTGQVTVNEPDAGFVGTFDREVFENDNSIIDREYDGLHTQVDYRFGDRLRVGGNWTWSHARGNFDGETVGAGPIASTAGMFPEFKAFDQYLSRGDLGIDSRHKVRAWAVWNAFSKEHNNLSLSVLQSFSSGTPYGALGQVRSPLFVDDPGYINPPNSVNYNFTSRDAFRTDDVSSTDLSLNYSFLWSALGRRFEVFFQPEVLNVFNEDGVINVNTSVRDAVNSSAFVDFDPFTTAPVQGTNWDFGTNFGQPTNQNDFQQPRTFRFSVGFRF